VTSWHPAFLLDHSQAIPQALEREEGWDKSLASKEIQMETACFFSCFF
jgi:hypothetical protein